MTTLPTNKPLAADVIIVGAGNAAMCAALTARKFVDRVLVLECADRHLRGGNTRHTRNLRHVHETDDGVMTGVYTESEMWEDLEAVSTREIDEETARMVIRESASIPRFMEQQGVRWQPPLRGTLHLSRTNRFFLGGGKVMLNAYHASAARHGIAVQYSTPVIDFVTAGRSVRGVVVRDDGEPRTLLARAVVVASGGFEANKDWLAEHWGSAAEQFVIRGSPHNRGGPLRALIDLGARTVGDPRGAHAISVDARAPEYDGGIVTRIDSVPLSIMVNKSGERFADEGKDLWPRRYASWGHLIAAQPDQTAYSIFDERVRGLFIPGVFPPYRADTIAQLGRMLGLPAEAFERTVREFNAATPTNLPFDHSRLDGRSTNGLAVEKTNWALPLDSPPYRAFPLRPGITFTYMGLAVDRQARVVTRDGPMSNLFAAGEIMSGNVLTAGYLAGFGITIGAVFGRLAGTGAGRFVSADT